MMTAKFPREFATITDLARKHISIAEDPKTLALRQRFRDALKSCNETLLKRVTFEVCLWKTPRKIKIVAGNTSAQIHLAWNKICNPYTSDAQRIIELDNLIGVSIPRASALLMFWDPHKYAVVDIYMIDVMQTYGELVTCNPRSIKRADYLNYMEIIRRIAGELEKSCRQVELSIYHSYLEHAFQRAADKFFYGRA